jgi:hypothetical protein
MHNHVIKVRPSLPIPSHPIPPSHQTNPPTRRFGPSSLHQRDPRNALFENYNPSPSPGARTDTGYRPDTGYRGDAGYRAAAPNARGQYSDAVLNELESQNDGQVEGIMGKVRQLKEVSPLSSSSFNGGGLRAGERMGAGGK